jgi:hypothetical protein
MGLPFPANLWQYAGAMKILNKLLMPVLLFLAGTVSATAAVIYNQNTSGNDAGVLTYVPNWTPGSTETPVPQNFAFTSWEFAATFDDETGDGSYQYTVTDGVTDITIGMTIEDWEFAQIGTNGEGMEPDFTADFWDAFWVAYLVWLAEQNNP